MWEGIELDLKKKKDCCFSTVALTNKEHISMQSAVTLASQPRIRILALSARTLTVLNIPRAHALDQFPFFLI